MKRNRPSPLEGIPDSELTTLQLKSRVSYQKRRDDVGFKWSRRWRNTKLKRKASAILGGVCNRCKIADVRVLQIDHIIPVGDTRIRRRISGDMIYSDIIKGNSKDYQLLCANCHMIKTYHE